MWKHDDHHNLHFIIIDSDKESLAALLPSDADNLYLVMTVNLINRSLFVLSKVMDEEAERKILQIGANKTINLNKISGLRIAQGFIRPALVESMDLIEKT